MGFLESTQNNPKTVNTRQNITRELGAAHEEVCSVDSHTNEPNSSPFPPYPVQLPEPTNQTTVPAASEQERQREETLVEIEASGGLCL